LIKSKSPRKQRKALYTAPLHRRQKLVAAHLARPLIKSFCRRSLPVKRGDEIKIMRGKYKGTTGKVAKVDLKELKVYIEGIRRKKVSGAEVAVPFHPSKLLITSPNMEDKHRKAIVQRSVKAREARA
jgi:large subunit ribosomal protein L24